MRMIRGRQRKNHLSEPLHRFLLSANAIVTNNRTPKGFSGAEVHSLGLVQIFIRHAQSLQSRTLPSFWWTGTKTANVYGKAGSQQECPYKGTPRKDM